MPRILDDDLFYRVQSMMNKNKNAPARTHGEGEYLLTTKLFCGHCKEMMVGYGGTSKTGRQYRYYMCKNARRKKVRQEDRQQVLHRGPCGQRVFENADRGENPLHCQEGG